MAERRDYSEAERIEAVAKVAELGLGSAWRETGIPKPTLARWAKKAGVETYQPEKAAHATDALRAMHAERREKLRVALLDKALDMLDRMDAEHVEFKGKDADEVVYPIAPASAVQNYATSAGILLDKYRLEMGEATSRNESRDLTHDDHEAAILKDILQAELSKRGERGDDTAGADAPAVESGAPAEAGTA